MQNDTGFWEKVVRVLDGKASQEERRELHQLLLRNNDLMDLFLRAQDYWNKSGDLSAFRNIDIAHDWQQLLTLIHESEQKRPATRRQNQRFFSPGKLLPYAAAILMFIAFSATLFFDWRQPTDQAEMITTIEAPIGSRSHVKLPDGSSVWLNAGSKLTYSNDFNIHSRHINLEGEAFFEVEKQENPFLVHVMDLSLRVLGTSFNIKAYEDDNMIETTLVSGSLVIEEGPKSTVRFGEIVLEPNQKATFFRDGSDMTLTETDSEPEEAIALQALPAPARGISHVEVRRKRDIAPEISWRDGVIVVEGEPLHELARKLERRYDVHFVFEDERLKSFRYTGQLRELTLEQVLHAMQLTSPIDYIIEDKTVRISENPLTKHKYEQYYD